MIVLQAPYPALEATSYFPNPQLADLESKDVTINIQRSMNGKKRVFVRDNGVRKLTYNFRLSRQKSFELQAFIAAYHSATVLLTNHLNEIWVVTFASNPFEFGTAISDTVKLDFEGYRLS
jgi:hypothetical protein